MSDMKNTIIPHNCMYCNEPLKRKRFGKRLEDISAFNKRKFCDRECMKKKIKDATFREFDKYCNLCAADGRWSLQTAIVCCDICHKVYAVKKLFGVKKAREKEWERLKKDLNQDFEIEI